MQKEKIHNQYKHGQKFRESKLKQPIQTNPSKVAWKHWKQLLDSFNERGTTKLKSGYQMGHCHSTPQQ